MVFGWRVLSQKYQECGACANQTLAPGAGSLLPLASNIDDMKV